MSLQEVFVGLEPVALWAHFSDLARIPRPSGCEATAAEWIQRWAQARGFAFRRDSAGNLCVYVPASDDPPGTTTVALQAHLDMICATSEGSTSDPASGAIEIARQGEWIIAPHSTLGADNGIGVAAAMALAEDEAVQHGPLELLFTVEEETTSKGADGLDAGLLHSSVLLNLDAESSGVLEIGCAGSAWTLLRWSAPKEPFPKGWAALEISLSGLRGGHSGVDINKNRLNGIKGVVHLVCGLAERASLRLSHLEGGTAFNAIPIRARATIAVPNDRRADCIQWIADQAALLRKRFALTDPDISVGHSVVEARGLRCWGLKDGERVLDLLRVLPSGVLAMEQHAPDQVETSNNVGIVSEIDGVMEIQSLARSSVAAAQAEVVASIESAARLAGAEFRIVPPVTPPWRVAPDSTALAVVKGAYRDLHGHEARLVTVHGAAEPAIILERVPRLDAVSLGPEIQHAHVPGERVNIRSVSEFYKLLGEVVKRLAAVSANSPTGV